jgi:chromosome segregation protein
VYFKSLELVGFKSFADKTVIGFEPGITAIVGPNGCGKSNVSDAIRWVLGEQNARNLRGGLMEDLIFGGSAQTEPMGMAEVSLILGDANRLTEEHDDEVTVSRRLFRSGESQYFLNNRPCRLKEIHRLLMNTGLGTQAYSHIQQGSIDLILSSKPEDRRFLFDETAGITKYKADKKEAVRKLEATEINLERLNDLIREVKRQIISIQRQAGKARRYKEFADELQQLDVGFLLHKRGRYEKEMESLESKRQGVEDVLRRLAHEVEEREVRMRDIRAGLQSSELTHEELQSRKLDLLRSIDREKGSISLCEQRITDTRSLAEKASAEIKEMRQKAAALGSDIRERNASLEAMRRERTTCAQRLKEREKRLEERLDELRKREAHAGELSGHLLDLIRREIEIRSRLSSSNERLTENRQLVSQVRRQQEEVLRSLAQKEKARKAGSRDREALSREIRQEKEQLAALRAGLKDTEEKLMCLRREMIEVEGVISRLNSERRFLTEAVEQYEGYDAGVRSIIEESRREDSQLRGIIATVADIIEVSPEHERVVESALENQLQWVLVETVEDARRGCQYLREQPKGRATFLPLEMNAGCNGDREMIRRFCKESGQAPRPAIDLVSFDARFEKVMEHLMGHIVLVGDLDEALALAADSRSDITFITPSGEKVAEGVAITAGARAATMPSFVSRKSRIASLVLEEEGQRKQLGELQTREKELLDLQKSLTENAEEQMAVVSGAGDRVVEAERSLLDISATIGSLRQRASELTAKEAQIESDLARLEDQRKALSEEVKGVSEEKAEVENAISSARSGVESVQKEVASLKKDVAEVGVARGSFDERIANLQSDIEYMRGQLDLTQKELETRSRQIEQGKAYVKDREREIQECQAAIASLETEKEEVTAAIEQLNEGRKGMVDELNQVEWEIKEKSKAAREREKETADLNIKLTEIRFSMNSIDEHLLTEYGLSHDDPSVSPLPEDTDWDDVQSRIAELKRRLQAMGPVNLCAIEEHETLKQRYEFLMAQQSDLLEAKDALLKAITRLDRESRALFREAFERIREEFQKMFQRLFGGGRADLILVDESNILESGIEIIARPPGKKLQAISLLSGGERAMTAISLLFAIFKVKPSPFCILDEIDAPLDDSNVVRFAEVLREFTENSQFIVITHNKRTISASDVLYGITMEESGKSKVVSARLTRGKEGTSAHRAEVPSRISEGEAALVTA